MSAKKIIFLIWSDRPGGIEVTLPVVINRLPQYNFSTYILRPKKNSTVSVFEDINVDIQYGPANDLFRYYKLFLFVKKNKSYIFHGFNLGPFVLFTLRLAKIQKAIYSIHGSIYWKTKLQTLFRKLFWQLSVTDKIVFVSNSEYSKKVFLEKVSAKPEIKVFYNPFNTSRFNLNGNKETVLNKLNICYVGRLDKGKNLLKWIETAEAILKAFPEFEFNIYGDGPFKEKLNQIITEKKLGMHIHLKGFTKDVENVYKENDLLLFLSEYESFGNVVVESILCGTPVIASRIPSMEEIFRDYPEFLVNLDEDLSKNVISKIYHYLSLKNAALKAAKKFKDRFSLEKHISELEKIYKSFE